MKHYKRVLELIAVHSTLKAYHNGLAKAKISTEDEWLQDLIGCLNRMVGKYLNNRMGFREPWETNYKNAYRESTQSLKLYCEQTIKSATPEWQKIAERNGWGPVNKS